MTENKIYKYDKINLWNIVDKYVNENAYTFSKQNLYLLNENTCKNILEYSINLHNLIFDLNRISEDEVFIVCGTVDQSWVQK